MESKLMLPECQHRTIMRFDAAYIPIERVPSDTMLSKRFPSCVLGSTFSCIISQGIKFKSPKMYSLCSVGEWTLRLTSAKDDINDNLNSSLHQDPVLRHRKLRLFKFRGIISSFWTQVWAKSSLTSCTEVNQCLLVNQTEM